VIMPNSTFTRKTCIAIIIKQIIMNRYSAKHVIKCDNSVHPPELAISTVRL
jgi:hypothetical protein